MPNIGRDPAKTFRWLVGLLHELKIPFLVSGGLAAKAYGSERPLNDIDIDIPNDRFDDLYPRVEEFVVEGPGRAKDERWDLLLMVLKHHGQDVDIGGAYDARICDARTGEWVEGDDDFSKCEMREIFGLTVPVMGREELMMYKAMLTGAHQMQDIEAIRRSVEPPRQ